MRTRDDAMAYEESPVDPAFAAIRDVIRRSLPPRVAKILARSAPSTVSYCAEAVFKNFDSLAGMLGYSRPQVLNTVEELDALPAGTVIRTDNTFPLEKVPNEFGTPWAYGAKLCANRSVQLPATVLYLPEEQP